MLLYFLNFHMCVIQLHLPHSAFTTGIPNLINDFILFVYIKVHSFYYKVLSILANVQCLEFIIKASFKIVSPPKYSPMLHLSKSSPLLKPWKIIIFLTIIIVLPFRMSYNWKHKYVPFKDWLLSLSIMHLSFTIFFLWLAT